MQLQMCTIQSLNMISYELIQTSQFAVSSFDAVKITHIHTHIQFEIESAVLNPVNEATSM